MKVDEPGARQGPQFRETSVESDGRGSQHRADPCSRSGPDDASIELFSYAQVCAETDGRCGLCVCARCGEVPDMVPAPGWTSLVQQSPTQRALARRGRHKVMPLNLA